MLTTTLRAPTDIDAAYAAWKCSCGPAAVAALLGRECEAIRAAFPEMERRGYANPTHIRNALTTLNIRHATDWNTPPRWPEAGLVFIQFGGPWMQRHVTEQYRHTHWIAVRGAWVYDVNAEDGWWPRTAWERECAPWLCAHHKGCDGTWHARMSVHLLL